MPICSRAQVRVATLSCSGNWRARALLTPGVVRPDTLRSLDLRVDDLTPLPALLAPFLAGGLLDLRVVTYSAYEPVLPVPLPKSTRLQRLAISDLDMLPTRGLKPLAASLKALRVEDNEAEVRCSGLGKLTGLQSLHLSLDYSSLAQLAPLGALTSLNLSVSDLNISLTELARQHPNLVELDLSWCVGIEGFYDGTGDYTFEVPADYETRAGSLAGLTSLTALGIGPAVDTAGLETLTGLRTLAIRDFAPCGFRVEKRVCHAGLSHRPIYMHQAERLLEPVPSLPPGLENLVGLTDLTLCARSRDDVRVLSALTALTRLCVVLNNSAEASSGLRLPPGLRSLDMMMCAAGWQNALPSLGSELTHLRVSAPDPGGALQDLAHLVGLTSLEMMARNKDSEARDLAPLRALTRLEYLSFVDVRVSEDEVKKLVEALPDINRYQYNVHSYSTRAILWNAPKCVPRAWPWREPWGTIDM